MVISNSKVILRDFIESDIEKRIHWEISENEWQQWDAPWEYEGLTVEEKKRDLESYVEKMKGWPTFYEAMEDDKKRTAFQIVVNDGNDNYIGWCNSYPLDDNYEFSTDGNKRAVGIDIPDMSARGKGLGYSTLHLFINYLISQGEYDIYTQTWSGNTKMIKLAEKLGFEECKRKKDIRKVRGQQYDGLTFRLNMEKWDLISNESDSE